MLSENKNKVNMQFGGGISDHSEKCAARGLAPPGRVLLFFDLTDVQAVSP